jgi:hypothetical protein
VESDLVYFCGEFVLFAFSNHVAVDEGVWTSLFVVDAGYRTETEVHYFVRVDRRQKTYKINQIYSGYG